MSTTPVNEPIVLPCAGADAILLGAARRYADRVALRDGETTLTYAELLDLARRVAGGLRERGVVPGEVVALHMPNTLWFIVAYYGALLAGAGVAPVNPTQPTDALERQLREVSAAVVFTHPVCAGRLEGAPAAARIVISVPESDAAPAPVLGSAPAYPPLTELLESRPLRDVRADPESVAHYQLTGGTTGRSKAVRVLHRNLVANVAQMAAARGGHRVALDDGGLAIEPIAGVFTGQHLQPKGQFLAVAPFFHGLGLVNHNINVLFGATVTVFGRFDPDLYLAEAERRRVTFVNGSPAMFYALLRSPELGRRDLTSVRLITSGSAPLDTTSLDALARAFPCASVQEGYGLSEATLGVCVGHPGPMPPGTVGRALPNTDLEVRGPEGAPLPTGTVGELWVRGPQVTDGYQDHPELTALQFRDGWLDTGDLARIDDDGYVFLVGRSKDIVIYKGYNVYPQPLEDLLCRHPDVAQAAVVGRPDPDAGEVPVAFVVLTSEAVGGDDLVDELSAHIAHSVAPYQRVRELHVVPSLPVTPTGKILKSELRARLVPHAPTD